MLRQALHIKISKTHPFDKQFSIFADSVPWELDLSIANVPVHDLSVLVVEGTPTTEHLKQQDTQAPKIDHFTIAKIIEENFGGEIFGCSAKGVGELIGRKVGFAQTKIAEGHMASCVEKDVFWFEITIDNVMFVKMLECEGEFCDVEPCPLLGKSTFSL